MCQLHRFVFAVKDDGKCPCVFKALKGGFKPFKCKVGRIKQTAPKTARRRFLGAYGDIPRLTYCYSSSKAVKVDSCFEIDSDGKVGGAFTTYYHDFTTQRKFQTFKMGAKGVCLQWDDGFSTHEKP